MGSGCGSIISALRLTEKCSFIGKSKITSLAIVDESAACRQAATQHFPVSFGPADHFSTFRPARRPFSFGELLIPRARGGSDDASNLVTNVVQRLDSIFGRIAAYALATPATQRRPARLIPLRLWHPMLG
jgi:hypothetical protein